MNKFQPDGSPNAAELVNLDGEPQRYDQAGGLFEFFSSQANAMLAQFHDINYLLGPTSDWTAPGTLCEVLVRDLIRRLLPSRYSVDKGFIFGRRVEDGKEVHSPEVDVLIHDTHEYAPVYRLEDFVIVRPEAVRGVIQVKRTLDGDKLRKAIDNLVRAKQHLRSFGVTSCPNQDHDIFSAAIFFADALQLKDGGISETYASIIKDLRHKDNISRPHFLGSLENRYYVISPMLESIAAYNPGLKARYEGYFSSHDRGKVALITFLAYLTQYILPRHSSLPLFIPNDHHSDQTIKLVADET